MICVMVVDDNPVIVAGLAALLETAGDIEVVGTAGDGHTAIEMARRLSPDLVLLDVRMPMVGGVEAAGPLSEITRVLMLSYDDDSESVRAAVRAGASGYLVHGSFTSEELVAGVRGVVAGAASPLSPAAARAVVQGLRCSPPGRAPGSPAYGLSVRETDVMEFIAKGRSNGEIARELVLSEKTVKNHVSHIYAKLDVTTRSAAVARWLGLATP